jgi:glycosyltransferase involved in cell wall biosynthesis
VLSVGHLISRKRHHVLLDAFAAVRRDYPNALLAIVGARSGDEPRYPDFLAKKSRELGLVDGVRFVGNIAPADVAVWLRAANVFALGTAREGCCNAVLEALGTGVPVVTTPAGDNAYFVRDAVNGFIVPIDDALSLAGGIRRALSRTWDRPAIARELYEKAGSWAGVGDRVLEFMNERLAGEAIDGLPFALSARK